jgi:hypothetical protein
MVAKFDRRSALLVSRTDRLRREEAMKTAGGENPNHGATLLHNRAWRGRSEQISLDQVGCEARKIPAEAGEFFLASPFIELIRSWPKSALPTFLPSV